MAIEETNMFAKLKALGSVIEAAAKYGGLAVQALAAGLKTWRGELSVDECFAEIDAIKAEAAADKATDLETVRS